MLIDALLRQGKFADLSDLVKPDNRPPALESKVRTALGIAAAGLQDRSKAETLLRDAIRLDPKAAPPKVALARLTAAIQPNRSEQALRPGVGGRSALGRGAARSRAKWPEPRAMSKAR